MKDFIVRPARNTDKARWLPLWEGYNRFYRRVIPDDVTNTTWTRFFDAYEPVHAFVAEREETLIGLVHYIFHRNTAMIAPTCYLQDLFTSEAARGEGVGRKLIERVYQAAREAGAPRVYWLTHETNTQAMILYDALAERSGFVQYRKDIAP
ncbi:MAG: GNAT family N-acetyltransferase [Proteobacteria bacterium]|nr:GNAT family N-acetyltransferase [Pseudomonadota bacterium]